MPSELVVIDWAGDGSALAAGLSRLLALGIDVVVVPSPATASVTATAATGGATGVAGGRLIPWPGDGDPAAWARERLLGPGAPSGAVAVVHDAAELAEQIEAAAAFPAPVADPLWRLEVEGGDGVREREVESWLTVGNGRTGTRGSLEEGGPDSLPALYVAGVFGWDPEGQAGPEMVRGPEWTRLGADPPATSPDDQRRILDFRQGILFRESGDLRTARFASLADRRLLVLEATGAGWEAGDVPVPPTAGSVDRVDADVDGRRARFSVHGRGGRTASFALATDEDGGTLRRLVAVGREGDGGDPAVALAEAEAAGPGTLAARHRRAWRERWLDSDVVVDGDRDAQHALRFALYHLIAAGDPESDAASVGARAMTGPGYRGHVFWDTEIFVLPFFVWTHPATARALLAYRYRTLDAARAKAARLGFQGALYAWESADTGEETTPESIVLPDGTILHIVTGLQEHHIAADVAWGVMHYWHVTGDDAFLRDMGAEMVIETARFWASRARRDPAGRYHVCEVIGPDEYHEGVDDNAYTNVLARWNLRAADALCDQLPDVAARLGVGVEDRTRWEDVARGLVDGFDPETKLYEQFDGFFGLDDVRAVDMAPRPFTGELVLGVERLRRSQVVKQADVLMLGVLLPDEVPADVEAVNYRHYEPRTSHGSSLSPAMHALVAARVGDLDDAQRYFELAAGVDLHNRMGNAADGVHIATMGGLWQAAVMGFGGVRVEAAGDTGDGPALRIDANLPSMWTGLSFPLQWRGGRVSVDVHDDELVVELAAEATVAVGSAGPPKRLGPGRHIARRAEGGWAWVDQSG